MSNIENMKIIVKRSLASTANFFMIIWCGYHINKYKINRATPFRKMSKPKKRS